MCHDKFTGGQSVYSLAEKGTVFHRSFSKRVVGFLVGNFCQVGLAHGGELFVVVANRGEDCLEVDSLSVAVCEGCKREKE